MQENKDSSPIKGMEQDVMLVPNPCFLSGTIDLPFLYRMQLQPKEGVVK